jgi:hypothetical protein
METTGSFLRGDAVLFFFSNQFEMEPSPAMAKLFVEDDTTLLLTFNAESPLCSCSEAFVDSLGQNLH